MLLEMIPRLLLALLIGGCIGWERESSNHPAGLRTHMLVALGAAVVMELGGHLAGGSATGPARLGAAVLSGIGFLGAGTIMKEGYAIRGLTTAASLWVAACLGLAAGAGAYALAICGLLGALGTLIFSNFNRRRLHAGRHTPPRVRVSCLCRDESALLAEVSHTAHRFHTEISALHVEPAADDQVRVAFLLSAALPEQPPPLTELFQALGALEDVSDLDLSVE